VTIPATVLVIMPTLACRERASSLIRAIESVTSQEGVHGIPLVVVNGRLAQAELRESLARRRNMRVLSLDEPGLPLALKTGRAAVDTPYFAVLDDDDELLPGALATRLRALDDTPEADVVVTNGYCHGFGRRNLDIEDFGAIRADPLRALIRRNWLRPCAGLFRTDAVPLEFFAQLPAYREWTYLGLRLALECKIRFVGDVTYVYHTDSPGALSRSKAYCLAGPRAMAQMLELNLPRDVRRLLRAHLMAGRHSASDWERRDGNYAAAWWWHLKSLCRPAGWRYLSYTRHLLPGSTRRPATATDPRENSS
jgi:glycosyltransferase involved in cell wall biosynthesis